LAITVPYPVKYYTFSEDKSFTFESGNKFGPITVCYETFGTLNKNKDNAILIIHALTGDSHVTSAYDKDNNTPGWWDTAVGNEKSIDISKYFVICSNCLGGCMGTTGPLSINPETGKPYGLSFPLLTVKDMVNVQKKLIDHLEIKKLKSVIGGSLGGMQVLEWSVFYPEMLESAIIIASAHKTSPQIIAFGEVGRNAIMADPNFKNGNYYEGNYPERGLAIARMAANITYLSRDSMESKFGRDIKVELKEGDELYGLFGPMFQVESYLRYQGRKFVQRFDANSYLYITKSMDLYDITKGEENLSEILSTIKCRMLVISFDSDWHFRPNESWAIVKAMMNQSKEISYVNINSPYGHDAFLIKNPEMENVISCFIETKGDNNGSTH
jgi:homoserine O-acetyltransferase/O-succinyltransferase